MSVRASHYFPGGLSTDRKKRDDRWCATARSSFMVWVAVRPKFETTQFIMGSPETMFSSFISVSLRYEMLPVMRILLCGVLGKIPRFMGEFGPRKARPDNDQRKDQALVPNGTYIYMVQDHIFAHVQAVRTRLLGGEPGLWNFFLNVPSER
jgi:hypothetical protein